MLYAITMFVDIPVLEGGSMPFTIPAALVRNHLKMSVTQPLSRYDLEQVVVFLDDHMQVDHEEYKYKNTV